MSLSAKQIEPAEIIDVDRGAPLSQALARLKKVTENLEAALHRRERQSKSAKALEEELEVLFQDRARLAHELDQVKSKANRLDAVSAEVAGRLDSVMADIGSVLNAR